MISDFGLSKTEESGAMATACGTPGYVGKHQFLWLFVIALWWVYGCIFLLLILPLIIIHQAINILMINAIFYSLILIFFVYGNKLTNWA